MSSAWFALYPGDYGRKTAHLSVVENGAYLLLLIHCYATGGPLPKDKAALYRIVRAHDEVERAAVDSVVCQFFVLREDGYHNDRATEELAKRAQLKQRLSSSGRKGAEKKWGVGGRASSEAISQASGGAISRASGLLMANPQPHPQSQEEPKNIPAPKAVRASEPVGFLKFWEAYPLGRRVDRKDAFRAWMKGGLELFTDQILAGLAKWVYCEQWASDQFIPHPATFLNKRRWEAEPASFQKGSANGNRRPSGAVQSDRQSTVQPDHTLEL